LALRREDGSFFFQIDFVLDSSSGSVVLAILTVCVSLRSQYWYPRIYGFWIIASSIWFFTEYHFIFNRKDDDTARDQELRVVS